METQAQETNEREFTMLIEPTATQATTETLRTFPQWLVMLIEDNYTMYVKDGKKNLPQMSDFPTEESAKAFQRAARAYAAQRSPQITVRSKVGQRNGGYSVRWYAKDREDGTNRGRKAATSKPVTATQGKKAGK